MSGRSASVPSGNHFASPSMNVRGISQGPRCEPATNSSVDSRGTGSTGIQTLQVLRAVDVVVRLVLVPGRPLPRARLLDQHVVVEQPHLGRCPSAPRRSAAMPERRITASNSGIRAQLQKSSKKRPGSSSRLATSARSLGSARLRSMPARISSTSAGAEQAADAGGAVAAELIDHGLLEHRRILDRGGRAGRPIGDDRGTVPFRGLQGDRPRSHQRNGSAPNPSRLPRIAPDRCRTPRGRVKSA